MKIKQQPATRVITLGRGVEQASPEGAYVLTPASRLRAEATVAHYFRFRQLFNERDGLIVFSGGYAGTSKGQAKPPEGVSEARLMADLAVQLDVPSSVIETESESVDTIRNFERTLAKGYFGEDQFTAENPLGVVASLPHFRRARWPAAFAFDLETWDGLQLIRAENETVSSYAKEWLGAMATRMAVAQVQPESGYAPALETLADQFVQLARPINFAVDVLPSYLLVHAYTSTPPRASQMMLT